MSQVMEAVCEGLSPGEIGETQEQMVIRSSILPGDGGASAVLIAPWGEVKSANGTFVLDGDSASAVIAAFASQGTEIPIDYEHQSLGGAYASPNGQAPAAGWIRALRAMTPEAAQANGTVPGLWADVEWTESARSKLVAKEYRYLSPVVIVRKRDRRVVALHSAALTNKPAIAGMRPIINRSGCAGLSDEETLLESSGTHSPDNEPLETLRLRLGLDADSPLEMVLVMAEERLAQLMREAAERSAVELVESALRAGKLTGNLRDWAMTLAMKDRAAFEEWMGSAPVVVMLGRTESPGSGSGSINQTAAAASARRAYRAEPSLALLTSEEAWIADALRVAAK